MLREELLGLTRKSVVVETEKGNIIVKELTAGEAGKYDNSLYTFKNGKPSINRENAKEKLVIASCYDEEGNKLFELKDIELVKSLPTSLVDRLFSAASELRDIHDEEKIEEAEKN